MYNLMLMLCVAALLGALIPSATSAQTSSPVNVAVTDLNADCVSDTVRLRSDVRRDSSWLRIYWGKRDSTTGCDNSWYLQGDRVYRSITTLLVEGVSGASYSVFAVLNNNDSYRDLVVSSRGTFRKVIGNDTLDRDTALTTILFAQRGLDSLTLIALNSEAGTHSIPVVHRTVARAKGIEVVDSTKSGREFIGLLQHTAVDINLPTTENIVPLTTTTLELQTRSNTHRIVRVAPNPVNGDVVDIHSMGLVPPLRLQIVSIRGEVMLATPLPAWTVHHTQLAIGELSNGMYSLQVIGSDGALAAAQFIILR